MTTKNNKLKILPPHSEILDDEWEKLFKKKEIKRLENEISQVLDLIHVDIKNKTLSYQKKCALYHKIDKKVLDMWSFQLYLAHHNTELFHILNKFFDGLFYEIHQKAINSPLFFKLVLYEVNSFNGQFFMWDYKLEDYVEAIKTALKKKIFGWKLWMIEFSNKGKITQVWGTGTSDWDCIYDSLVKGELYPKVYMKKPSAKNKNYTYRSDILFTVKRIKSKLRKEKDVLRKAFIKAYLNSIKRDFYLNDKELKIAS